jgi:uncharacterized membrane protein YtjA (UPF0391 family)
VNFLGRARHERTKSIGDGTPWQLACADVRPAIELFDAGTLLKARGFANQRPVARGGAPDRVPSHLCTALILARPSDSWARSRARHRNHSAPWQARPAKQMRRGAKAADCERTLRNWHGGLLVVRGTKRRRPMSLIKWALVFLVISLIAAIFGFGGIAAASADIARILFFIFVVIFVVLLVLGLMAARRV